MNQFTFVTHDVTHLKYDSDLMPVFIIVVRRWVTNRFFEIIALEYDKNNN